MSLPAIPEPRDYRPDHVDFFQAAVAWVERETNIDALAEVLARLAALELYVSRRDVERLGEAQLANRRTEARIGELLGESPGRGRSEMSQHADSFHRQLRSDFRSLARYLDDWWPNEARRSRRQLLNWIYRLERRDDDSAARAIVASTSRESSQGNDWTLTNGDSAEVLTEIPEASIDLIVTDPPYSADFLGLWSTLAEQAARVLVPQGVLCALSGQLYLPDVITALGEHLTFGWIYCQPLPGSSSRLIGRHIGQAWKPWLTFTNGVWPSERIDWHPDVLDGVPMQKLDYHWQQTTGPAAQLIGSLSVDGATVLDPFAGSGSYGVAALEMGRRFIGIEKDSSRFETACRRLTETEEAAA